MPVDEKKVDKTKEKQKSVMDKMQFFQIYALKNSMMGLGDAYAPDKRKEYGFHSDGTVKDSENRKLDELKSDFFKEYLDKSNAGTLTLKDVKEVFRAWGLLCAKNRLEMGREQKAVYDSLPDEYDSNGERLPEAEQIRIKNIKADYLAYGAKGFYSSLELVAQDTTVAIDDFFNEEAAIKKNGHRLKDMIWNDLNFNPAKTTFKDVMDHIGFEGSERAEYMQGFNAEENDNFFEKYKIFLKEHEASVIVGVKVEDVADSDIINYFRRAYYDTVISRWNAEPVEDFEAGLSESERKLYSIGAKMRTDGSVPPEFDKWEAETGIAQNDKMFYKNVISNLKKASDIIQSEKALNSEKEIGISESFKRFMDKDTEYIEMIIDRLEATKTGHGTFHGSNSEKYEKMLASVKAYKDAVDNNRGGDAKSLKEEMIDRCLKYISGKEKVREADFGNERFKNVMALLSKELEPEKFDELLATVNRKRGFRADRPEDTANENYVTREKYENYLSTEGAAFKKEAEKKYTEVYLKSTADRLHFSENYRDVIEGVEGIYGRFPRRVGVISAERFPDEDLDKLSVIDEEFVPIGPHAEKAVLSEKDFATISFAGAMTPAAFEKTGFASKAFSPEDNFRMKGYDYTLGLLKEVNPFKAGGYWAAINHGRMSAAEAMRAYKNGDKAPLANILSTGIRYMTEEAKGIQNVSEDIIGYAEMAVRMSEMLDKDKELRKLALRDGLKEEDINYTKTMYNEAEILINAQKAQSKLKENAKNTEWSKDMDSPEKRIEALTDIIMKETLDSSMKKCDKKRDEDPEFSKEVDEISAEMIAVNKVAASLEGEGDDIKKAQEQLTLKNEYLQYRLVQSYAKHRVENPMMNNLHSGKFKEELRESVKEAVINSGLQKLSPQELTSKLSKSGSILKKVAVLNNLKPEKKKEVKAKQVAEKEIKVTEKTKKYTENLIKKKAKGIEDREKKAKSKA
ncbi:hypothetical protein SAMN04487934_10587 [Eubacterium ruminantium]|nr:hypothetical protein SAMN04487934_10587 [Eubacterium ruminantium]